MAIAGEGREESAKSGSGQDSGAKLAEGSSNSKLQLEGFRGTNGLPSERLAELIALHIACKLE